MHRPPLSSEVLGRAFQFADRVLDAHRCSDQILLAGCDRSLPWTAFFPWKQPVEADCANWRLFSLDHLDGFELAIVGSAFTYPLWSLIPVLKAAAVVVDVRTSQLSERSKLLQ